MRSIASLRKRLSGNAGSNLLTQALNSGTVSQRAEKKRSASPDQALRCETTGIGIARGATAGPKQCLGCALCSRNLIIGACSVCGRRCCRGCIKEASRQCWSCLGYSSPQEEEAKMTTGSGSGGGNGANTALYERRPGAEDDEGLRAQVFGLPVTQSEWAVWLHEHSCEFRKLMTEAP